MRRQRANIWGRCDHSRLQRCYQPLNQHVEAEWCGRSRDVRFQARECDQRLFLKLLKRSSGQRDGFWSKARRVVEAWDTDLASARVWRNRRPAACGHLSQLPPPAHISVECSGDFINGWTAVVWGQERRGACFDVWFLFRGPFLCGPFFSIINLLIVSALLTSFLTSCLVHPVHRVHVILIAIVLIMFDNGVNREPVMSQQSQRCEWRW